MALIGNRLIDATQMTFNRIVNHGPYEHDREFRKQIIDGLKNKICFDCGGILLPWINKKKEDECTCD